MMTIKIGDIIIAHRPTDQKERDRSPMWTYEMDDFDGKEFEVTGFSPSGFVQVKGTYLVFNKKWVELVTSDTSNKYYKICRKIKAMERNRKELGYAF